MGAAEPSEARFSHRKRVIKGAAILTGVSNSEIRCVIRNMTEHGAELKLPGAVHLPSEFLLYVALDGLAYRCVLRWRDGEKAGVEFVGTEPKPHWHYG